MIEQTIRTVRFETLNGELTPRFGLLGNTSFQKQLLLDIEKKAEERLRKTKATNTGNSINLAEIRNDIYDETFPTLNQMNIEGWILESFAVIYDDNKLQMQVAIFTRNR